MAAPFVHLRLRRNELATLALVISSTWLVGFYFYADDLKFNYYVSTEAEFMARLDKIFNASTMTHHEMVQWLGANRHRANLNSQNELLFDSKDSAKLKLCIGVLTKRRNNGPLSYDYVSQTVVSILARTRLSNQANIRLTVFNADSDRSQLEKKLGSLVHIEQIQKPDSIKVNLNSFADKKVKEAVDYISVMKALHSYPDCKYGLLVEDDSIAAPDWYERLITALNEIELASHHSNQQWICLKLFTGFRWYDWVIHGPTVLSSLVYIAVWGLLQTLAYQLVRFYSSYPRLYRQPTSQTVITVIFANLLVFTVVLNSSSIKPLGHGVKVYNQGFNAVAVVYPREQLKLFADYLEDHIQQFFSGELERIPKDILLSKYKGEKHLNEYIVEPSLFQHVGVHSSVRKDLNRQPTDIKSNQYRPFQSYSFMKSYGALVTFDPVYWTSNY